MYVVITTEYYEERAIAPVITFEHESTRDDAMRRARQRRDDLQSIGHRGEVEIHSIGPATLIHCFTVPSGASPTRKRGCRR